MSREETLKVLTLLQTAYPSFYRNQTPEQARNTASLWQTMFAEQSFDMVSAAVTALIATRAEGYPPTIGAVNEMIQKLTMPPTMSESEAWAYVLRALSNGIYHAKEEWEALPEEIRDCISPETIRQLAMDEDFNAGVESSNFLRIYRARQQSRKEQQMLPERLKAMIAQANSMMLEMT